MNTQYNVTQTIQSPDNDPVTMKWATSVSGLEAAAVVARILADFAVVDDTAVPESVRPRLLSIEVEALT